MLCGMDGGSMPIHYGITEIGSGLVFSLRICVMVKEVRRVVYDELGVHKFLMVQIFMLLNNLTAENFLEFANCCSYSSHA